ncbi:MAG: ABC transporter permease [Oscillospiraceae bacterium]
MIKKIEQKYDFLRTLTAIAISMLITLVIVTLVSNDPIEALTSFLTGPLQSARRIGNVIEMAIPLSFTGVAICIMFEANQFNCAGEGAFFLGSVAAAAIAINWILPAGVHQVVILLLSGLVGACICAIPAVLKLLWQADVLVSSLMLNYLCLFGGLYVVNYYLIDPAAGFLASQPFLKTAKLPVIIPGTRIHLGLIILALCIVFAYVFLYKSRRGYALRMVGKNENFAKYTGVGVTAAIVGSQLVGGFICGAAGGVEMMGMFTRFQYQALPQYGFDGIIIATLANNKPQLVPLAAVFLAYVRCGADVLSRTTDVPVEIVSIIQAIAVIFVAAKLFLNRYKQRAIEKAANHKMAEEKGVATNV